MAKVRGTKVVTARSISLSDWDIQKMIERESTILANQGKTVIDAKLGEIRVVESGDQTCLITLIWEADDTDPNYVNTPAQGCYIATCVYGSYDCPEVWTLRRYRDNKLACTRIGSLFVKIYYSVSPTIVKWFGNNEAFKSLWKNILDKKVKKLRSEGVEDTPYDDKIQ